MINQLLVVNFLMKKCFIENSIYKFLSFLFLIIIWWILSIIYPAVVIPSIPSVIKGCLHILKTPELLSEMVKTIYRLFLGVLIGLSVGVLTGLLSGLNRPFRLISNNWIKVLQVVPPVSILVLTIIWFGFNGKPAIAITALSVFPTIAISVRDGILNIDKKLLEMAKIFKFPKKEKLRQIIMPSIMSNFLTGLTIALGIATKTVVMGEVLTTVTGIGGQITNARLNIESEMIIAWTIVCILIYYFVSKTLQIICRRFICLK